MSHLLRGRRFLSALAVSVVAVGATLPIGFPKHVITINFEPTDSKISLRYWHIYEALRDDGADLDMDSIVIQLTTQKLLTYNA